MQTASMNMPLFVCLFVKYVILCRSWIFHPPYSTMSESCAYFDNFPCIFSICQIAPTFQACTWNVLNHYTWSLTGDIAYPTVTTLRGLGSLYITLAYIPIGRGPSRLPHRQPALYDMPPNCLQCRSYTTCTDLTGMGQHLHNKQHEANTNSFRFRSVSRCSADVPHAVVSCVLIN